MRDINPDRLCLYDSEVNEKNGKIILSCTRAALPHRMVCHKHAPLVKRRAKDRAKRKVRREQIQATRNH